MFFVGSMFYFFCLTSLFSRFCFILSVLLVPRVRNCSGMCISSFWRRHNGIPNYCDHEIRLPIFIVTIPMQPRRTCGIYYGLLSLYSSTSTLCIHDHARKPTSIERSSASQRYITCIDSALNALTSPLFTL